MAVIDEKEKAKAIIEAHEWTVDCHPCLTGDCPHDHANDCVSNLKEDLIRMCNEAADIAKAYLELVEYFNSPNQQSLRAMQEKIANLEAQLKVAVEGLEKLKAGPGNRMVGWQLTWVYDFAEKVLARIEQMGKGE